MATFYSNNKLRDIIFSPQFTRRRHRYRGPRESEKINLEHSQMRFSIYRLYEMYRAIRTKYLSGVGLAENGDTVQSITVEGFDDMARRLQRLQMRVKALEE